MIKISWGGGPANIVGHRRLDEEGNEVVDLILQFLSPHGEVALEAIVEAANVGDFLAAAESAAEGRDPGQAKPAKKIEVVRLVPPGPGGMQ